MSTDLLRGFRLGDLLIEPLTGQVMSPTGARHVPPKAMQVLVCLAESPGELVTREALLQTAWGDESGNASLLSHAVSELRSALDDNSEDPKFIQTIPRRGYRLLVTPASTSGMGKDQETTSLGLPVSSVWTSLMKHGVVQAAAAFLIVGWLLIQVAGATFEDVGLPAWSTRFVTYVVIAGFPVVLVLAWFLEAAGGRLIRDRGDQTGGFFQGLERNYLAIVAAYGLAAIGMTVYHLTLGFEPASGPIESNVAVEPAEIEVRRNSIAVLRFLNIDGSDSTKIFSDGVSEDLLDKLTTVPGLSVSSRGDSWSLPPNANSALVRQRLRVAYFVEGSVQREADALRIVAQLIDSENGFHLVSRSFDRDLSDFMGVQREITRLIVANLRAALPEDTLTLPVADNEDADVDAYVLYRRGMDALYRPETEESLGEAIDFFGRALQIDSDYPAAHAGLCRAYVLSYDFAGDTRYIEPAEAACSAALAVKSRLDIAYVALGDLYRRTGRHRESINAYERALDANARSVPAMTGLARAYERQRRFEDAEVLLNEALLLEPGNWQAFNNLGRFLFASGRYDEAAVAYRKILAIDPDNWQGLGNLGSALLMTGDFENAATALQRSIEMEADLGNLTSLAGIYYYLGRFEDAVALHRQSVKAFPESEISWMNLADALLFSSDADEAMSAYQKAAELAERKLALDPRDAMTLCFSAWAGVMAGDSAVAENRLQRALQLAPENPYVHYYDALIKTRSGDFDSALDALSVALANGYPQVMLVAEPLLSDLHDTSRFLTLTNAANREIATATE